MTGLAVYRYLHSLYSWPEFSLLEASALHTSMEDSCYASDQHWQLWQSRQRQSQSGLQTQTPADKAVHGTLSFPSWI